MSNGAPATACQVVGGPQEGIDLTVKNPPIEGNRPLIEGIDLIVGNPPWGKNIGTGEVAVRIIQNTMASFPGAFQSATLL
jgi:hypothetical protein